MVAVALATLIAAAACAQYPSVTGVIGYNDAPLAIEVSPSGNRLGFIEGDLLKTCLLRDDGFPDPHGPRATEVELPGIVQMAFTPNGHSIICADITGGIHIVRRSDWSVDSLQSSDGQVPVSIDTIDDPRRAFVQYRDTGRTTIIDYRDAEIVGSEEPWRNFHTDSYRGRDMCVTDGGRRIFRLYVKGDPEDTAILEALSYDFNTRPTSTEVMWTCPMGAAAAICLGPDDNHLMAVTRYSGQLYIIHRKTGYVYPRVDLDMIDEATDVCFSDDGRFVVITSASPPGVVILWANDLLKMMSLDIEPEDVRRGHVGIFKYLRPRMSCLHPTLNVGYIMCAAGRSTQVIELAVPGTADDGGQ